MRRLLALSIAFVALIAAGFFWTRDRPVAEAGQPVAEMADEEADAPLEGLPPATRAPRAAISPEQREARRFNRYDRDKDEGISREEYLASRRKAYAKLDLNNDGKLSFEEYAAATARKFRLADRNGDGRLARPEFETTAVKRKAPAPACKCVERED